MVINNRQPVQLHKGKIWHFSDEEKRHLTLATAAFTLTNSTIAATDVVIVNVASVGTAGAYQVTVGAVAAGSCSISVLNVSGGSLSEAIKLNFAVIKAVAS